MRGTEFGTDTGQRWLLAERSWRSETRFGRVFLVCSGKGSVLLAILFMVCSGKGSALLANLVMVCSGSENVKMGKTGIIRVDPKCD